MLVASRREGKLDVGISLHVASCVLQDAPLGLLRMTNLTVYILILLNFGVLRKALKERLSRSTHNAG